MRFNDHITRDASLSFKTVDVLSEELQELALFVEKADERMGYGWAVTTRI